MSRGWLIRDAEVEGTRLDVRIRAGLIDALAPALDARPGERVLDAAGGALLPGLHDHHLHLLALGAALASVRCGPPEVTTPETLARALAHATPRAGWVRGIGYHESVAGPLDRVRLDALAPRLPVRVQHRSGALWIVNSPGAERLGLDAGPTPPGVERDARGRATGRLFRLDRWLRERLGPPSPPPLAPVGTLLAAAGVTGVTDATPSTGGAEIALLEAALGSGALPQRVIAMGDLALPRPTHPRLVRGAVKILLDDDALPGYDELLDVLTRAHAEGRAVAVHCVTRSSLVLALSVLDAAGARPGDRIEHASVAPPEVTAELARLSLTVVTQPNFVAERGDVYLEEVEPRDRPWLYRAAGLIAAGVAVGGGTDAPFGAPDPWAAMQAAVERRTPAGRVLGTAERLTPERALALFTSSPGAPGANPARVRSGAPADLCLLDRPWALARVALARESVRATFVAGRMVHPVNED